MKLTKQEKELWNKYKTPGCSNLHRRKINAIFISPNNSKEHEMAKCSICYDLQADGKKYITEAAETAKTNLRRDIINLTDQEIIEIDNSASKRGRRHEKEINVFWYNLNRWRTPEEINEKV